MEDNLTSADPPSYITNGSRVDLKNRVSVLSYENFLNEFSEIVHCRRCILCPKCGIPEYLELEIS